MKKISVTNLKTGKEYAGYEASFNSYEDLISWKDARIADNTWGKPEREIIEFSESYDEADVISTRSEEVGEGVINYVTLRAEYDIIEEDITDIWNYEQSFLAAIANGERAEKACRQVKQYVTGYNMSRAMTAEQISSFIETFGTIQLALDNNRPNTTRTLIEAVVVDGTIVTQELKDNCLECLARNGF